MSSAVLGRPRAFDRADALRLAAGLFWQHGFSGTSTRMLSAALGISTSSLYAAFGSKSELFDEAIRTYAQRYSAIYSNAIEAPGIREVFRRVLLDSVREFTREADGHPGCLTTSAVMADTSTTLDVRTYVSDLQQHDEQRLERRIARAVEEGQLPSVADPALLAAMTQTLWQGLAAQADIGVGRAELTRVAHLAVELLSPQA